ncbi:hypothetical protein AX14_000917 [Amanita brunnescens Koide BX004]|nr:hypothetical protein AX14_000917 [Amanita brunnescens Koide BX004]
MKRGGDNKLFVQIFRRTFSKRHSGMLTLIPHLEVHQLATLSPLAVEILHSRARRPDALNVIGPILHSILPAPRLQTCLYRSCCLSYSAHPHSLPRYSSEPSSRLPSPAPHCTPRPDDCWN